MSALHSLIVELRLQRGWKQKDLAMKLGRVQSRVCNWESGRYQPQVSAIADLSQVFGVALVCDRGEWSARQEVRA